MTAKQQPNNGWPGGCRCRLRNINTDNRIVETSSVNIYNIFISILIALFLFLFFHRVGCITRVRLRLDGYGKKKKSRVRGMIYIGCTLHRRAPLVGFLFCFSSYLSQSLWISFPSTRSRVRALKVLDRIERTLSLCSVGILRSIFS